MMQDKVLDNIVDPSIFPAQKGPPHALFDHWRQNDPVHWNPVNPEYTTPVPNSTGVSGFWVLTRYQDVLDVSMDQERFSSHEAGIVLWDWTEENMEFQRANFMMMKPDDHKAVKKVIMPPFMPRNLKALAPRIDKLAREIVDSIASRGECEFVFEVASRLPVYTFCELMGIPEELREQVAEYGNGISDVETRADHSMDPMMGLVQIATELAEEKRRNPDDGLMSAMVNDTTLNLDPMQIAQFFIVFAMAGHETTRSTAAHFIYMMSQHREQYDLLLSDTETHLDNAIDEVLRFTSTTTNFCRTAMEDTTIGDVELKKGAKIYLSYAAANRDPGVFENPHKFDITRNNAKRHLAFGVGPHVCVASQLAKMQLRSLLMEILTRIPDIRPLREPEWMASIWFNAIIKMPVEYTSQ